MDAGKSVEKTADR